MSLVVADNFFASLPEHSILPHPPKIVTTPCDPWPRPYYFEAGLRRVLPYHFTYQTNCKERWRGRELLDIFVSEFRDRPAQYYEDAIKRGLIVINGQSVSETSAVLKNGDRISHTIHRHEPPVTAQSINIVHEDDDLIVINKPAGIPVHPAGRYNYNSLVEIMRAERGMQWNPLPCNRLDRLTSGIMFIGKHPKGAEEISERIRSRTVQKEYVARVRGQFPDGEVECSQPVLLISPKLGLNRVRANGKQATTIFKRLAYYPPKHVSADLRTTNNATAVVGSVLAEEQAVENGIAKNDKGYSIVHCQPITGRTHQIRVHLQYLGFPISNDPIYCNQQVFGPSLGYQDASASADEDIISRLSRMGKEEVADALAYHEEIVNVYTKAKAEKMNGELCAVCHTPLYLDPGVHELGIYLHARRYACQDGNWGYETPLPDWALPPGDREGHSGDIDDDKLST